MESDSTNNEDSFHVSYDFEGQEQTIRTVYHKINGVYNIHHILLIMKTLMI